MPLGKFINLPPVKPDDSSQLGSFENCSKGNSWVVLLIASSVADVEIPELCFFPPQLYPWILPDNNVPASLLPILRFHGEKQLQLSALAGGCQFFFNPEASYVWFYIYITLLGKKQQLATWEELLFPATNSDEIAFLIFAKHLSH